MSGTQTIVLTSRAARLKAAMKPLKKGDERRCAYLYADGTVVVWFERSKRHRDLDTTTRVEYWKVAREAVPVVENYSESTTGSLVVHETGFVHALEHAARVSWYAPSVEHGSDNTKARNIAVGGVRIEYEDGTRWSLNLFSGLISSSVEARPGLPNTFDLTTIDPNLVIAAIYVPPPEEAASGADGPDQVTPQAEGE